MVTAFSGAAVELYYDNVKKIETTSSGVLLSSTDAVTAGSYVSTNTATAFTAVDGATAYFGTGLDLRIYHDASHSWITNTTGDLMLKCTGDDIVLQSQDDINMYVQGAAASPETAIIAKGNGPVELYYDGAIKLTTEGTAVKVFGLFVPSADDTYHLGIESLRWQNLYISNDIDILDNGKILLGTGDDLQIYHDGTSSYIDNDTGWLNINTATGGIQINKDTSEYMGRFVVDGASELYYDNSKKLSTTAAGAWARGELRIFNYSGSKGLWVARADTDVGTTPGVRVCADASKAFVMAYGGSLRFQIGAVDGTAANALVIDQATKDADFSGDINVVDNKKLLVGTGDDLQIYHDASNSFIKNSTGDLYIDTASGSIHLSKNGTSEVLASFNTDSSVTLRYDNVNKFETTSNGTKTTGYHQQTGLPSFLAEHRNTDTAKDKNDLLNAFLRSYGVVRHNTGSHFNNTTGKFTAPVAGLYFFSVAFTMDGGDEVDDSVGCYFRVENNNSGSLYNRTHSNARDYFSVNPRYFTATGAELSQSFQTIEKLEANATVGWYFTDWDGTDTNLLAAHFTGHLIG